MESAQSAIITESQQHKQSNALQAWDTLRKGAALLTASVAFAGSTTTAAASVEQAPFTQLRTATVFDTAMPNAITDPFTVYNCEQAARFSFTNGREQLVRNTSGRINGRFIRQIVNGSDIRTIAPDGDEQSCVGVVKRTVRAGESITLKRGGSGINTRLEATPQGNKPEVIHQDFKLGSFHATRKQRRLIVPHCGDKISQYVEFDVSPVSDPSQVYGRVYKSKPVTIRCS